MAMAALSKTQIDQLGDRVRRGTLAEADLRALDDYRRSFGEAYELGEAKAILADMFRDLISAVEGLAGENL